MLTLYHLRFFLFVKKNYGNLLRAQLKAILSPSVYQLPYPLLLLY